jgi:hypothetical protein
VIQIFPELSMPKTLMLGWSVVTVEPDTLADTFMPTPAG